MKVEYVAILGGIAIAAYALFKGKQVIEVEKIVPIPKPFLVEVPTAIITPQPNIFTSYDVSAGMAAGAVQVQAPEQITTMLAPEQIDRSNEPSFIARYNEYMEGM